MAFHKIVAEDLQNIADQPIHWEKLREKTVLITGVNGMIAGMESGEPVWLQGR